MVKMACRQFRVICVNPVHAPSEGKGQRFESSWVRHFPDRRTISRCSAIRRIKSIIANLLHEVPKDVACSVSFNRLARWILVENVQYFLFEGAPLQALSAFPDFLAAGQGKKSSIITLSFRTSPASILPPSERRTLAVLRFMVSSPGTGLPGFGVAAACSVLINFSIVQP